MTFTVNNIRVTLSTSFGSASNGACTVTVENKDGNITIMTDNLGMSRLGGGFFGSFYFDIYDDKVIPRWSLKP